MSQFYSNQYPNPYQAQQYMQPQYMQPQSQQQPQYVQQQPLDKQAASNALANFIVKAANGQSNQLTGQLYSKYSNNQWNNQNFQDIANVAYAACLFNQRTMPGAALDLIYNKSAQETYEIVANLELQHNPQLMSTLSPQLVQSMAANLSSLQVIVNNIWGSLGQQPFTVSLPGVSVQMQHPTMMPQQVMMPQQYMQQPQAPGVITHGVSMFGQQQSPQPKPNYGLSNARPQGIPPTKSGPVVTAANMTIQPTHQRDFMPSARIPAMPCGRPANNAPIAPQEAPVAPATQVQDTVFSSVKSSYSTPNLHQAIQREQGQFYQHNDQLLTALTQQALDRVEPLSDYEEDALFNVGTAAQGNPVHQPQVSESPVPTFAEIFNQPSKAPEQPVHVATAPTLNASGLPDGWMYTEATYDTPPSHFFDVMMKAKRNPKEPLPISYDKRFTTRLYRYLEDGSIEQKLVGVPMDRLKHDLSVLDTPQTADAIIAAEPFSPLKVMGVHDAVKVIHEPDTTSENITEKLKDTDIFVVNKPIIATSRQEGVLLSSAMLADVAEHNPNKHGTECYVREIRIITSVNDVETFCGAPEIKNLSAESKLPNIIELAENIRAIRAHKLLSDRALRKITDQMVDVINQTLTYDYGYAGTLELEKGDHFEDEVIDLVMWLNSSDGDPEVLSRINTNWVALRKKLCTLLIGNKLTNMQAQLAKRYPDVANIDKITRNIILMEEDYSITILTKTDEELRITHEAKMFAGKYSERPYLYQVLTDIKKRTDALSGVFNRHIVYTRNGVELNFTRGGLGDGNVFMVGFPARMQEE